MSEAGGRPPREAGRATGAATLAGFLVLIAVIFCVAYLAGAHFGPLAPGGARIQPTGTTPGGGPGPGNMGGMGTGGSP